MKILVLSDSHAALSFMRRCIDIVKPQAVIHLGDYFDDGTSLQEWYPQIPFYQVPGNCDRFRCPPGLPEIRIEEIFGVRLYLTHGHKHRVKSYLGALLQDARASGVDAVLYGHTHRADCQQEPDGLWVLNPGSCGSFGGSAGLITIQGGKLERCSLLTEAELSCWQIPDGTDIKSF